jgi:hypothetical protein
MAHAGNSEDYGCDVPELGDRSENRAAGSRRHGGFQGEEKICWKLVEFNVFQCTCLGLGSLNIPEGKPIAIQVLKESLVILLPVIVPLLLALVFFPVFDSASYHIYAPSL